MTAAFDQALRKATFAFFAKNSPVVVGGTPYWIDSGPHGLNASLNNFTAPAYGKALNGRNRPCIGFDGSNDYCDLPLRFYDDAPTEELTVVLFAEHLDPAEDEVIFDCVDPGSGTAGWKLYYQANDILELIGYDSGSNPMTVTDTAAFPIHDRTLVTVVSLNQQAGLGEIYHDMIPNGTFAGSPDPIYYKDDVVPTIGCAADISDYSTINIYALLCFPWAFSYSEADEITASVWDWAVG